jgi:hypothetical protein
MFFEKKEVKLAPGTCWRPTCWHPIHIGTRHVGARYMFVPDMLVPGTLEPLKLGPNMFAPMPVPACACNCFHLRPVVRWCGDPHWHGKSNLLWVVSQRRFDPYRAGTKVYQAYRAGGPPHRQPCLEENGGELVGTNKYLYVQKKGSLCTNKIPL